MERAEREPGGRLFHGGAHQGRAGLAERKGTQGLRKGLGKKRNNMTGVGRQLLGSESFT